MGPLLAVGAVLRVLSLARQEGVLELSKLPGQPASKFVNWKCRVRFTSLPFPIHFVGQPDSGVDFAWLYVRRILLW